MIVSDEISALITAWCKVVEFFVNVFHLLVEDFFVFVVVEEVFAGREFFSGHVCFVLKFSILLSRCCCNAALRFALAALGDEFSK